jgi:Ca2+-binding RTX toxin-like protein
MGTKTLTDASEVFAAYQEGWWLFKNWKSWDIKGKGGNDTLTGGPLSDTINGGTGSDWVNGKEGNDFLYGANWWEDNLSLDGGDTLYGGVGDDQIIGESGNDYLFGEADQDTLLGGSGSDYMDGGTGNDYLAGYGGDGWLASDETDTLTGGGGADTFVIDGWTDRISYRGAGYALITDFNYSENDKIQVASGASLADYQLSAEVVNGIGSGALDTVIRKQGDILAIIQDRSGDAVLPHLDFIIPSVVYD